MNGITSIRLWWHKLWNWEYWPFEVLYFPVSFYYLYLSIKAKSFFFFTASNPSIDFGGMLGESKDEIFRLIPDAFIPLTRRFSQGTSVAELCAFMNDKGLQYPVICKPDIGERGWMVTKVTSNKELRSFLENINTNFIIQEFIDLPLELGVFYYRLPNCSNGVVSSIVSKDFLHVTGDGHASVYELVCRSPRALMQLEALRKSKINLNDIPKKNEKVELVAIGNHCKGTTFINSNEHITSQLTNQIDRLSKQISGFYFGRFDLRCTSYEALSNGDFKIMELNGAGAEPAHIYQPGYSLLRAYRDITFHLRILYEVSRLNKNSGQGSYATFKEGIAKMAEIRRYNKQKG